MKTDGAFDAEWMKRAMAAKVKGERALAFLGEAEDTSECLDPLEEALRDNLGVVSHVVEVASSAEELRNPTWRTVQRERDRIRFANDLGQTATLRTRVAVDVARGVNLPYPTEIDGDEIVFYLGDGEEDRAPLSLIRALSPRRWPAGSAVREVPG